MRVRRPRDLIFRLVEVPCLPLAELTTGHPTVRMHQGVMVCAPPMAGEQPVDEEELRVLMAASPDSWVAPEELSRRVAVHQDVVTGLAEQGLLRSEGGARTTAPDAEERHRRVFWDPYAASYHFTAKWRDAAISEEESQRNIRSYPEPAPDPFLDFGDPLARVPLQSEDGTHPLDELLRLRHTCRSFEPEAELPLSELSDLVSRTYGCRGVARLTAYTTIRRGSPSGGGLHPTEGYLLVRSVEGLTPGLYHYNMRFHSLDLLRGLTREEARRLALLFVAGQDYFADAQVMFIHVARTYRHTWKYRHHAKSYRVLLLDVGHLSQTFYLACTARGLGAFFTGAINDENIEEELTLDPLEFSVIGVNGCGIPTGTDPHQTSVEPFVPASADSA